MNDKESRERSGPEQRKGARASEDREEQREAASEGTTDDRRTAGQDEDGRVPPGANGEDF